jgi:hypothetical protein
MPDATWTCPSCKREVDSKYCPGCGERPLRDRELTLRGFIDQLVQAFTSIDGRLIRSFRYLVTRPGFLTVAFLQGRRKPYLGPIQLFLLANVLFFAAESLTGGQIFTTPLEFHLSNQPWSAGAQRLVARRLETTHRTLESYAPVFNRAMALHARSLIILMALAFALMPALVFRGAGRPTVTHGVFALHTYAYLLLLFCIATGIPAIDHLLGGAGFASEPLDHAISVALLLVCGGYLFVSTGTVYGARGPGRVLKTLVLTLSVGAIVLAYRLALLLVTLYTT